MKNGEGHTVLSDTWGRGKGEGGLPVLKDEQEERKRRKRALTCVERGARTAQRYVVDRPCADSLGL